ncbi:hypothetical protein GCM10023183_22070 [Nibribacter koreensis]|uniref:Uncharacterized protein n=1 Tax=Nibribacter koreensis TaxID=1084519 RepID=A0ABP8FLK7_9BACT
MNPHLAVKGSGNTGNLAINAWYLALEEMPNTWFSDSTTGTDSYWVLLSLEQEKHPNRSTRQILEKSFFIGQGYFLLHTHFWRLGRLKAKSQ